MCVHIIKHIHSISCASAHTRKRVRNKHMWRPDVPICWLPHSLFALVFETGSLSGPGAWWFSWTVQQFPRAPLISAFHSAWLLCGCRRLNWHLALVKQALSQLSLLPAAPYKLFQGWKRSQLFDNVSGGTNLTKRLTKTINYKRLKKQVWPGLVAPAYNPNTWGAEADRTLWVLDHMEFHNETVSCTHRKKKKKQGQLPIATLLFFSLCQYAD